MLWRSILWPSCAFCGSSCWLWWSVGFCRAVNKTNPNKQILMMSKQAVSVLHDIPFNRHQKTEAHQLVESKYMWWPCNASQQNYRITNELTPTIAPPSYPRCTSNSLSRSWCPYALSLGKTTSDPSTACFQLSNNNKHQGSNKVLPSLKYILWTQLEARCRLNGQLNDPMVGGVGLW